MTSQQTAPSFHEAIARAADPAAFASEQYRLGDNLERAALLRLLPTLPRPSSFVELAVAACRSSVQPIFEAICCENPYAARYFGDAAFNQMVLKALFTGVALSRVVGLASRLNPELGRMARDYRDERRAAGRSVPADIGQLIAEDES